MSSGFLYIVNGKRKYFTEAVRSVGSLRRHHDGARVTLITDPAAADAHADLLDAFDDVLVRDGRGAKTWKDALFYKSDVIQDTPYERTFFVDSDTYFLGPCGDLFDLLDHFELLIAHAPADGEQPSLNGSTFPSFTPYNTGVMLWRRSDRTDALLADWSRAYAANFDLYPHDQPAFMEALAEARPSTYVLSTRYNFRTPFFERAHGEVVILHGRDDDLEATGREINRTHENRVWLPTLGMCVAIDMGPSGWGRLLSRAGRHVLRQARARIVPHRTTSATP